MNERWSSTFSRIASLYVTCPLLTAPLFVVLSLDQFARLISFASLAARGCCVVLQTFRMLWPESSPFFPLDSTHVFEWNRYRLGCWRLAFFQSPNKFCISFTARLEISHDKVITTMLIRRLSWIHIYFLICGCRLGDLYKAARLWLTISPTSKPFGWNLKGDWFGTYEERRSRGLIDLFDSPSIGFC